MALILSSPSRLRRFYRTKTLADWYRQGQEHALTHDRPSTVRVESVDQWVYRAAYEAGWREGKALKAAFFKSLDTQGAHVTEPRAQPPNT
jgi:hypothetical protein